MVVKHRSQPFHSSRNSRECTQPALLLREMKKRLVPFDKNQEDIPETWTMSWVLEDGMRRKEAAYGKLGTRLESP